MDAKNNEVKVFSTRTCPYCFMLKDFLKGKDIPFVDIDVSTDYNAAMDMIRLSGQRGVPVSLVNGKVVIGFDPQTIMSHLN
jgi:glutaredoxin-like YruB-family protein